jgi:thioredoxin 1
MVKITELNDLNFEKEIKNVQKLAVVDFYATWCGHCLEQLSIIDEFAKEADDDIIVATINVDDNNESASEFFISAIPAILIFKNGRLVEQRVGLQGKEDLKKMVKKHK